MRNSIKLSDLHSYLQIAMAWSNTRDHQFLFKDLVYGISDEMKNESSFRISQLLKEIGEFLVYEYALDSAWQLEVKLERILPFDVDQTLPNCVGGRRASPPEEMDGISAYEACIIALDKPGETDSKALLKIVESEFDPEHFDTDIVNERLGNYTRGI